MFSPNRASFVVHDPSYFRNAPFSKLLMLLFPICTTASAVLRNDERDSYKLSELRPNSLHSLLIGLSKHLFFSELQMMIPAACLIYSFRLIERHLGSSKFMAFLSGALLTALSSLAVADYVVLPFGPIINFTAMYAVFLMEVPFVSYGSVFGLPLTVHTMPMLMLAQLLLLDNFLISSCIGLVTVALSTKAVDRLLLLPSKWLDSTWFQNFLEPSTVVALPIAATIERQRIEAMDALERQFMRSQMNQIYGGNGAQNGAIPGYIDRLLGTVNGQENRIEVSEESIQQLMDMGFRDRDAIRIALIQAGGNIHEAANILLVNGQAQ
ncbi:hypothetical protein QR680_017508 [Steinernema hermaphroditum]|uniref:UBA domain-containing protein n=1 Tax=Steinernema hermaphroditum TaxID=289476 RepID=A0AA39LPF7_9BILA|nr:hypothetical protein QR680_017508 [Steinernema hermaphroditum]